MAKDIEKIANSLRLRCLRMIYESQSGHPGGSFSLAEIMTLLYFEVMNIEPANPQWPKRDRLILSKGHGAPILYSALIERGYIGEESTSSFRKLGGLLQGHPVPKIPGVDSTSGSLGAGLSMGVGIASALKLQGIGASVYVILGDGELNEGLVWEAVMAAKQFKLDNLIAVIDNNNFQNDGPCEEVLNLQPISAKFDSFGWESTECNGHDIKELRDIFINFKNDKNGKPKILVAHTIKGYGATYLVQDYLTHYVAPNEEQWEEAKKELQELID